jgi:energy-coupling factor transport system ATP-binding protein
MDSAARRSLATAVAALAAAGSAMILATHDRELAAELADRSIEMVDGRAIELAAPEWRDGAVAAIADAPPAAASEPSR